MRSVRLAFLFLLCFLATLSTRAQWPYVPIQQAESGGGNGASETCVFDRNVTSGNIIIVSANWETASGTPTVTDTRSTTYSQLVLNTANNVRVAAYVGTLGSSGSNTVTFAETGAGFMQVMCSEYPPNWTTTLDVSAVSTFSGTPATVTSSSITTTLNTDLIYSHIGGFRSAGSMSINSGSIADWTQAGFHNGQDSGSGAFRVGGTNGSYNVTWNNVTNDQGTVLILALKSNSIAITSDATGPDGDTTNAYDWTIQAAGGAGSYTYSVTSGALPSGLSINSSTGEITGTPTVSNNYTATIQVSDGTHTATKSISISIKTALNAITFVQGKQDNALQGQSSMAFTSNVTAGNLLVVNMGWNWTLAQITYCTDTVGTNYRFVSMRWTAASGGSVGATALFVGTAPSSGANTVNCVDSGLFSIGEFTNASFFANDNENVTRGSTASPATVTSSSLTTLVPNELLLSVCQGFTGGSPGSQMKVDSPFTGMSAPSPDGHSSLGYRIVTTVTGYTSSCDMSANTSNVWMISVAGIRPSGGTVTPPATARRRSHMIM